MPEVTVKDFYDYTQTTSQDGDMLLLVAVPAGAGTYVLRNITKDNLVNASQVLVYDATATTAASYPAANAKISVLRLTTSPGTIAAATIAFPTTPEDGWIFDLTIKGTVTALTANSGTDTVEDFPSTITDGGAKWIYDEDTTTWLLLKGTLIQGGSNLQEITDGGNTTDAGIEILDPDDQSQVINMYGDTGEGYVELFAPGGRATYLSPGTVGLIDSSTSFNSTQSKWAFGANSGQLVDDYNPNKFVTTTDATVTTVATVSVTLNKAVVIRGVVVGRRTGGSSGSTNDSAGYSFEFVASNTASVATVIGQSVTAIGESQAGWDVTITASGAGVLVQVTGATNNNITWNCSYSRILA